MAYIACSSCRTNYIIADSKIGQYGRTVKCSQCNHIWHVCVEVLKEDKIVYEQPRFDRQEHAFRQGVNLPALRSNRVPTYFYIIPVIFAIFFVLSTNAFGILDVAHQSTNMLSIKDIQFYPNQGGSNVRVIYKIKNYDSDHHTIPQIRIKLIGNKNKVIKTYIIDQQNEIVEGKKSVTVKTDFNSVKKNVKKVDIKLLNKFNLLDRIL